MEKQEKALADLKKQAAAITIELREEACNSSREHRGSYKSLKQQDLDHLRWQIKGYEEIKAK